MTTANENQQGRRTFLKQMAHPSRIGGQPFGLVDGQFLWMGRLCLG